MPISLTSTRALNYCCSVRSKDEVGRAKIEDSIPVIEIRGEGKPMSAAQIRHLEELSNGGPLDIKIEKTWLPAKCETPAKRKDFVTFHYKVFTEDGKKVYQTYGESPVTIQLGVGMTLPGLDKVFTEDGKKVYQTYGESPVTIQLGVGMTLPGLDKGLKGMCDEELRKLQVPHRLSRKGKSRVWKNIPNDEHWLTFNLEMIKVEPYSLHRQFQFLDVESEGKLTQSGLEKWLKTMKKDYGKSWKNEDIDNVRAVKYYIRYFDINEDGVVDEEEFTKVMKRDETHMEQSKSKAKGRKRDPGIAWILDFDNDGIVSYTFYGNQIVNDKFIQ
ncbi:peptidyl-prolyl cis-trans isomerase, FKBP-type [Dictyocaulus viviparus]|uniref:peptidylprolyl isomerase n=1 Tax=Dictyocaulus viviparus TaxID=29172 RepID=A0A0D8XSJ1_DICVI|nr:peptidyl-prolyl cis-trans isomerase, FKBP-type [Dictyocaulus viviparus]